MLRWSIIFFVLALVAAFFGFGGIASTASEFGKILFFVFLAFAIIGLVRDVVAGRRV